MRLVPWQPKHFLGWFWGVPVFAIITLPASVPALAWLLWPVRSPDGERERTAVVFLLVWVLSNLVFLTFAPAKASRYMLPVFAPVALLGAYAWRLYLDRGLPPNWDVAIRRYAGVVFGVGGVVAIVGLVAAVQLRQTGRYLAWPMESADTALLLAAGGLGVLVAGIGLVRVLRNGRLGQWALIVLMLCLTRPMYLEVIVPRREVRYGHREVARTVDEYVPAGQPVLVFGKVPMPDMEIYSQRHFAWTGWKDPNAGKALVGDGPAYFLMYEQKEWERFEERLRFAITDRLQVPLGKEPYVLVTVDFSQPTGSPELAADR
jgi:4-amino-4-deoxy-L-arabinose transferase-like glycosyltransferase